MSFSSGESVLAMLPHDYRRALGVLPSPLWGGVGGGGRCVRQRSCVTALPLSPALPHKGGGRRPSLLLPLAFLREHRLDAARECPRGAGRNAQASARQARRDAGGAQPLAVDSLLARIGHASLQIFACADRAVAGRRVGQGTKALDPHAPLQALLGGVERRLE